MEKQQIDEIVQTIKRIIPNWQTIASILGAIVLFGALGVYFMIHYNNLKKDTWEKIAMAQGYMQQGMNQQAVQLLDELINKYSNSDMGQHALFVKADLLFKTKNYNLACNLYERIINNNKAQLLKPFAYAGLGYANENLGNYDKAINIYKEFLDKYSEHFLAPRIYDSMARVYLLNNSQELAKQTYEKLLTLYPGTYWANKLQGINQPGPGATAPSPKKPEPEEVK